MSRLYVYAVMRAADAPQIDLPAVEAPDMRPSLVPVGDLVALTSPVGDEPVMATRRNMLGHTRILEAAMRGGPILPFRFGTIAASPDALVRFLGPEQASLARSLDGLDGRFEVGVRMTWADGVIFREIMEESPDLRRLSDDVRRRPANETYYDRIGLGREVEARMARKKADEAQRLADRLGALAVDRRILEPGDDLVVLNAAFLLAAADEPAFFREIEAVEAEAADRFAIRYVAPVPPYNFVALRLDGATAAAA